MMKQCVQVIIVLTMLCLFNISKAQTNDANYQDGQLYVKLIDSFADTLNLKSPVLLPLIDVYNITAFYRPFANMGSDSLDRIYKVKFKSVDQTDKCLDALRSLTIVDFAERVLLYRTLFVPNDPDSNGQYFLKKINARSAWDISKGSPSVVVAIIDNAMLASHQDLAGNMVPGYDVADNDDNTDPPATYLASNFEWNHGTHCSGDASAVTNNGVGVSGIGFNTKIMPVKCTSDTSHTGDDIDYPDEGIAYAMQHGASVISMSWGGYGYSLAEQILINVAINKGIVMVAAAGNNDSSVVLSPAAYKGVICVGATDSLDKRAPWSNYGGRIDVMAPGDQIYRTFALTDSSYHEFSGTSMSCPIVAGLCALVLAQNPSYTPVQVLDAIKAGADDISSENPGFNGQLGAGRINAFRALGGVETIVTDLGEESDIEIYPNPFNNQLNLRLNKVSLPATIQVTDMQGRTIIHQEILDNLRPVIDTYNLQSGFYVIRVTTDFGVTSSKMVKI